MFKSRSLLTSRQIGKKGIRKKKKSREKKSQDECVIQQANGVLHWKWW